jgi:hypothetical protein
MLILPNMVIIGFDPSPHEILGKSENWRLIPKMIQVMKTGES